MNTINLANTLEEINTLTNQKTNSIDEKKKIDPIDQLSSIERPLIDLYEKQDSENQWEQFTEKNNKNKFDLLKNGNQLTAFNDSEVQKGSMKNGKIINLPKIIDGLCHKIGRSENDQQALGILFDFKENYKEQFPKIDGFRAPDLPGKGASELLYKSISGIMGKETNDNYLNALNEYKEWRNEHPNANEKQIKVQIEGMLKPFKSLNNLYERMDQGTLLMDEKELNDYNKSKIDLLSQLMEYSYQEMNKKNPEGWTTGDIEINKYFKKNDKIKNTYI